MRPSFNPLGVYQARINYAIDHESVGRRPDPIVMIDHLVDKINDPGWDREQQLCDHCEGWTPQDGDKARPKRPGTPDPILGCSGCWYSNIDKLDQPIAIKNHPIRRLRQPQLLESNQIRWDGRRLIVESVGWYRLEQDGPVSREEQQPFREPGSYRRAYLVREWGQPGARNRPWDKPNEDGHWVWLAWISKWLWVAK